MAREVNEYIMRIYGTKVDETTPLIQFEFVAVSYEQRKAVEKRTPKNNISRLQII